MPDPFTSPPTFGLFTTVQVYVVPLGTIVVGGFMFIYKLIQTPFGFIYKHIATLYVVPKNVPQIEEDTGLEGAFERMSIRGGKNKKHKKTRKNKKRKTRKLKHGKRRQTKNRRKRPTKRH